MSAAGVGPPSDDHRAVCCHTGPNHAGPLCGQPATVHVLTVAADEAVTLPTCDAHAAIARRAGSYQDEHEHQGVCGLPGTVWVFYRDRCDIDDSGVEPELVGAAEATQ